MRREPDSDESRPDTSEDAAPRYPGKGFRLGEYVIVDKLGHGSMATIFLAKDATGHEVALKIFQEGPGVSPTMLERFRREAEAAKKLRRHPNIMKVYATAKEGPYHYIVMEPIKNSKTFEDVLEVTPLSIEQIVRISVKIARALHYAHGRNIIHRDVKPSNIMIDEFAEPLLTDFGVAALVDWPSFTLSGALTGTPLYMSPEQARGERVGPPSDIYSLGVVLYEGLTGVLPYSTQHAAPVKNVLEAVKTEAPRRPRFFRKDISPDLEAVILKALEKESAKRYPDGESFASDLERALAGRHVSARLFSYWERFLFLAKRYDQVLVAGAVILVMVLTPVFYFRHELLQERYEKLLNIAQLRNVAARLSETVENADEPASQTPAAWHSIRQARRAMNSSNWQEAANEFRQAVELSLAAGDPRTAAIAQLDLARCKTLLGDLSGGRHVYRQILESPDTSPSVGELAQLETLILALLQNDRNGAVEVLGLRPVPTEGPVRAAIDCLSGETDTGALQESIALMPQRLRNDALLAMAVRYQLDGNIKGFSIQLKRCMQFSSPPNEWPGPLAKSLLGHISGRGKDM
ncbi:MAG TPA: serine/threonine-protein kinase [Kiritimatiellia bacterium]|jgi:serine/threonine protein kinase